MTRAHDFKHLVRRRMSETGQSYTAARAELVEERRQADHAARREYERLIRPFFDGARLASMPTKRKARAAVLLALLPRFQTGQAYDEPSVNALLRPVHADVAYLRRELVDLGYLSRQGGIYRLPTDAPQRDTRWAHEFPAWERVWLPSFLRGSSPALDA